MLLQKNRALLEWLGRYASFALPIAVFVGLALPGLANLMGPLLTAAVIGTLTSVVIRLDWSQLADAIRAPRLSLLILGWQLLFPPLLIWWFAGLLGLPPALAIVLGALVWSAHWQLLHRQFFAFAETQKKSVTRQGFAQAMLPRFPRFCETRESF